MLCEAEVRWVIHCFEIWKSLAREVFDYCFTLAQVVFLDRLYGTWSRRKSSFELASINASIGFLEAAAADY
jgi:hypothetical protein